MRTDIQELRDRRGGLALEDSGNGVTPNTWQLEAEMPLASCLLWTYKFLPLIFQIVGLNFCPSSLKRG